MDSVNLQAKKLNLIVYVQKSQAAMGKPKSIFYEFNSIFIC